MSRELYRGKGVYVQLRSIPSVINELEAVKSLYRPSCFFFHDDVLSHENDYYSEFLNIYKEKIGLPYACFIRATINSIFFLLKAMGDMKN